MSESEPLGTPYPPGTVVWAKVSKIWLAGQVVEDFPPDLLKGYRNEPLAVVNLFNEGTYYVIQKSKLAEMTDYQEDRKIKFIRQGLSYFTASSGKDGEDLKNFRAAVIAAEKLTGGSETIFEDIGEGAPAPPPKQFECKACGWTGVNIFALNMHRNLHCTGSPKVKIEKTPPVSTSTTPKKRGRPRKQTPSLSPSHAVEECPPEDMMTAETDDDISVLFDTKNPEKIGTSCHLKEMNEFANLKAPPVSTTPPKKRGRPPKQIPSRPNAVEVSPPENSWTAATVEDDFDKFDARNPEKIGTSRHLKEVNEKADSMSIQQKIDQLMARLSMAEDKCEETYQAVQELEDRCTPLTSLTLTVKKLNNSLERASNAESYWKNKFLAVSRSSIQDSIQINALADELSLVLKEKAALQQERNTLNTKWIKSSAGVTHFKRQVHALERKNLRLRQQQQQLKPKTRIVLRKRKGQPKKFTPVVGHAIWTPRLLEAHSSSLTNQPVLSRREFASNRRRNLDL